MGMAGAAVVTCPTSRCECRRVDIRNIRSPESRAETGALVTLKNHDSRLPFPRLLAVAVLLAVSGAACRKQGPPLTPYVALVANSQSNSVAAVDLATFRVIRSVPVASGPAEIALRPHSQEVYVATASGSVSVIGFPDLRVLGTLEIGRSARDLVFSADGSRLYALDPKSGDVVFADAEHGRIPRETGRLHLGGDLAHLALTPDGKALVAADRASNRLVFISADSRRVLGSVEVGRDPGALVILPDSSQVLVADTGENKVSAVDVASRQILAHLELAAPPTSLALKPDGGELFVLCGASALVSIIDTSHDNVEQNLPAGALPAAGVFRRDSSVLYVANAGDGSVTALDVQNRAVLDSTHAGAEPRALALTPDEQFLVVVDAASASVAILRAVTSTAPASGRGALVTTVPVGARPVAVAVPDWRWEGK